MKLLFILLIPICLQAQEPAIGIFPTKEEKIYYEKIIAVDSVSKDELFKRSKSWALNVFNSQKNALQSEDKDMGYIFYKAKYSTVYSYPPVMGITSTAKWDFNTILKIFIKEGRIKITIEDVRLDFEGVDNQIPLLAIREQTEPIYKKLMYGKAYRQKLYEKQVPYLKDANTFYMKLIDDFEKAIDKKSEFNF